MALIARSADFYGPDNEKSFVIEMVYKNLKKGRGPIGLLMPIRNIPSLILLMQQKLLHFLEILMTHTIQSGICLPTKMI